MSRFPISKADAQTNAQRYLTKRAISAVHGSSIRKLIRGNRIAAGLRPLHVERKHERVLADVVSERSGLLTHQIIQSFELHPTKGVRNQRISTREVA